MPRFLVLHASVGTGHKTAAEAVAAALKLDPANEVRVEDTLEYATAAFRTVYTRSYLTVTTAAPQLWKQLYEVSDTDNPAEIASATRMRGAVQRLAVLRFDKMVQEYAPDAIICSHPLPVELLLRLRRSRGLRAPIYLIVTDHVAHEVWICPGVDGYFVPSELPREMMVRRGVPEEIIHVSGIPVALAATQPKDQREMRVQHGLPTDQPVVCLFGGGLLASRVRRAVEGLLALDEPALLIVVAGRNAELTVALNDLRDGPRVRLRVLEYVNYVDDLLAAADLAITKAGGLIVSEVLARGTPLLVIDPIPGHEEWNADYVVSVGAGLQLRLPESVPLTVLNLLLNTDRLEKMRTSARRAGRPTAALDIATLVSERLA